MNDNLNWIFCDVCTSVQHQMNVVKVCSIEKGKTSNVSKAIFIKPIELCTVMSDMFHNRRAQQWFSYIFVVNYLLQSGDMKYFALWMNGAKIYVAERKALFL